MPSDNYSGILFIGDPHLSDRTVGFRRDNYCETILGKLEWSLDLANSQNLLPALLGDLFHFPRDNSNSLLVRLMRLLERQTVLGIVGNHDVATNSLEDEASLAILHQSGCIRLVDVDGPWVGTVSGRTVVVGGTTWSAKVPKSVDTQSLSQDANRYVVWLTHDNVQFAGFEGERRLVPHRIEGVDLVVNGHIHRPLPAAMANGTLWINPGNISRIARADAGRDRQPSVTELTFDAVSGEPRLGTHIVPHLPFEEAFHELGDLPESDEAVSPTVLGLRELTALRTAGGEGLMNFLDRNLDSDPAEIRAEILSLAKEVIGDEQFSAYHRGA